MTKNLGLTRTFAVRRLRGSPHACTVARYLIRVLTGARRKRIGISLKNIIRPLKKTIFPLACFLQITSGRQKHVAVEKGGIRLYKPCNEEIVRSAPKWSWKSKILAWRDHLEQ